MCNIILRNYFFNKCDREHPGVHCEQAAGAYLMVPNVGDRRLQGHPGVHCEQAAGALPRGGDQDGWAGRLQRQVSEADVKKVFNLTNCPATKGGKPIKKTNI